MMLRKTLSVTFFLVIATISIAQESWTTLNIPVGVRYDDICFVNKYIGWTAGGNSKKIHKTTNAGRTWTLKYTFPNYLRSIKFMDENIGLCGSLNGSLYRTTDGGTTWTDVALNISPRPAGVCGLAKADENTVYGVGIWSSPAFVIKSTDKGINWTYKNMSAYASTLIDVFFFDALHGFVTGSINDAAGGIVLYTEDGGETWVEKFRTNHLSDRIWKIQTPDSVHFYGAIESFVEEGPTRIIRSSDAGQTWEMIDVDPDYYYCQAVGFIDSLRGWTGGKSTLFETTDGGATWNKVTVGSTYNRFVKINEDIGYLTGSSIYKFNRGVVTGTPDLTEYDPIHHMAVSPNPATTGLASLNVTFGNATTAQVYLYSVEGKHLKRVFNDFVEAGERKFDLDLSDTPTSTVLVILKTNEGTESVKLVRK